MKVLRPVVSVALPYQINQYNKNDQTWKHQNQNASAEARHQNRSPVPAVKIVPASAVPAVAAAVRKPDTGNSQSGPGIILLIHSKINFMSLYTLASGTSLGSLNPPAGLELEESVNAELLAALASISVDEVRQMLANDHLAYVAFFKGIPAGFGWMARGKARIGELNHDMLLPLGNRYLWNFRTLEPFRGLGIYPALLHYIIRRERQWARRFWIIHAPENRSSSKGIRKAGFQFVGNMYTRQGKAIIEATALSLLNRDLLEEMNIEISYTAPASCWNCSSPFLKKKLSECCCLSEMQVCRTGQSDTKMALPLFNLERPLLHQPVLRNPQYS